jgi:hypothetical protein
LEAGVSARDAVATDGILELVALVELEVGGRSVEEQVPEDLEGIERGQMDYWW